MADQWLHMYHQNHHLSNQQPSLQLSDDHELVSDSTVVTAAVSSATTPPVSSSSLSPDRGRVGKPVRKRSRASRRTPTTLLNTDAANFRAMVQQFTGGPSNNANNVPDFAFGLFPGGSHPPVFDPTAASSYHHQPPLFHYQNQPPPPPSQQPPFMFSLSNTAAASHEELFFQTPHAGGGSSRNNVNYNMGLFDGSSPAAQHPRPS